MGGTRTIGTGAVLMLAGLGAGGPGLAGQAPVYDEGYEYGETYAYGEISARIWFDRGDEPLLERGERVRIYYRTDADAYVAIFNIDTDGMVRLVYPSSPAEDHYVRGGRDYRLLFPRTQYWYVDDHPGMGYYFIVASPEPFDFSSVDYSYYDRGWDLTRVGRTVYSDPYVAMDDYVAALIPDWQYVGYALDFSSYHVGPTRYDYPRFLCYDCHGFRSYNAWNPYHYACSTFRVVVYTDPWFYPSFRYRGTRVVYARPPRPFTPHFDFKERAAGDPVGVQYVARPPVADRPGVAGDRVLRRSAEGGAGGSVGYRPGADPAVGSGAGGSRPGVPPSIGRPTRGGAAAGSGGRPSGLLPGRGGSGSGVGAPPTAVLPRTGEGIGSRGVVPRGSQGRPVLERRGRTGGGTPPSAGGDPRVTAPPTRTGPPGGAASGSPPVGTTPPGAGSPPPVRTSPPGAGATPPARTSPPGAAATPPVRTSPPTSGSGPAGAPPVGRAGGRGGSEGVAPPGTTRGGGSAAGYVPVLDGGADTPSRRWTPVLGGARPSSPARSAPPSGNGAGGSSTVPTRAAAPTSGPDIRVYRGGARAGTSPSFRTSRSGGPETTSRGRAVPSRPSAVLGGARPVPGAVRGTSSATGSDALRRVPGAGQGRGLVLPGRGSPGRAGAGSAPPTVRTLPGRTVVPRGTTPPAARGRVGRSAPTRRGAVTRSGSSGRSGATARPPVRSGRTPAPARTQGAARPPVRPGASAGPARATGPPRPPVRRGGGGAP